MNKLWEYLKLNHDFDYKEVDDAYIKLPRKTYHAKLAWKILRDKYYNTVYKRFFTTQKVMEAGFIFDNLDIADMDYYNLDLLTTPVGKILDNFDESKENPIVLVTTGGFDPLHEGHIYMMEEAKRVLELNGYNVMGGYFSPSHDTYVSTKPYNCKAACERVAAIQDLVEDHDWLMVDPWEAMYVKTCVNFTAVVDRLELYLQKHIARNIRVAYVFGGDNALFMHCFNGMGIGVCIERNDKNEIYQKAKEELQGSNIYFIDNKTEKAKYSSRDIRQSKQNAIEYNKRNGIYAIRNESILPLIHYKKGFNEKHISKAQEEYLEKFITRLNQIFDNELEVKVIDVMKQLKTSYEFLKDKKTISLDSYYKGTYNIELSRLFDISDAQKHKKKLINRLTCEPIETQMKLIEPGEYILVDDDSATGATIKGVKELLTNDIKIVSVYLLASVLDQTIFDIIDFRDFIIGAINSGLTVRLPNGEIARAPYVYPYVSLKSRAKIKTIEEKSFSIDIWKMNKEFYKKIDKGITLKQTDIGFRKLMNYIGFTDDDLVIDICDWHINRLEI